MPKFKKLTVTEIIKETADAVSILFEIPAEYATDFKFIAGQYITLRTIIEGKEIRRSYSICSSPESGQLWVAVKEVKNGIFSNFVTKKLKVGDVLEVAPPEGRFILQTATTHQNNYVAFVAGSGITPVMSMIKSVLLKEIHSTFVLVYGNKSAEDTIFKAEIDALQARFPEQFFVQYIFSRKISGNSILGRIDKSIVNLIVKNQFKSTNFNGYYLCGPEEMINEVTDTLKENDVPGSKIHYELFTTMFPTGIEPTADVEGTAEITILLDDEETTFDMPKKQLILTAALDQGLDAPYSCQGGVCCSCMAKVVEGKAIMDGNSILSEDEINEGFILTCQAHPVTSKIKIDFDDV